jgi:hypothetical protein
MPAPKMSLSRLLQLDSAAVTVAAAAAMPFLLAFLLSWSLFRPRGRGTRLWPVWELAECLRGLVEES